VRLRADDILDGEMDMENSNLRVFRVQRAACSCHDSCQSRRIYPSPSYVQIYSPGTVMYVQPSPVQKRNINNHSTPFHPQIRSTQLKSNTSSATTAMAILKTAP
jgi:hypothetical protein